LTTRAANTHNATKYRNALQIAQTTRKVSRGHHTLKNTGLFQTNFGSNMDKPNGWVTFLNSIKKIFN